MFRKYILSRAVLENVLWFLASLAMAFFVWVIAIAQTDPIVEKLFMQIPVLFTEPDTGLLLTDHSVSTVRVNVRAQQSVMDSLTKDDITVRANLTGLGEGTHIVELQGQTTRRATTDTQPTQVTITLERLESKRVAVTAVITAEPVVEFEVVDEPKFDENQVRVSGAVSKVERVVGAQATLDLSQQRTPLEQEVRLTPVDADGNMVADVTIEPQAMSVSVNIRQRADIRQVSVRPTILFDTLPEGFSLSSINYDPQTILVNGSSGDLENLPDTLETEPIDLSGRTSDFEALVPVQLPEEDLLVIGGETITVSVGITAPITNRQFDEVAVSVIGLADTTTAQISPEVVTVVITGPRPDVEAIRPEDIQVVVDLNRVETGIHAVPLKVAVNQVNIAPEDIAVLPANVDVNIRSLLEATEEPVAPDPN